MFLEKFKNTKFKLYFYCFDLKIRQKKKIKQKLKSKNIFLSLVFIFYNVLLLYSKLKYSKHIHHTTFIMYLHNAIQ